MIAPSLVDDGSFDRATRPPPALDRRRDPFEPLDEVLFRFTCGDFEGALAAADALLTRVPVIIIDRVRLRSEPLDYWELQLLNFVDDDSTLLELYDLADMPLPEAVRAVCDLAERKILALR